MLKIATLVLCKEEKWELEVSSRNRRRSKANERDYQSKRVYDIFIGQIITIYHVLLKS